MPGEKRVDVLAGNHIDLGVPFTKQRAEHGKLLALGFRKSGNRRPKVMTVH